MGLGLGLGLGLEWVLMPAAVSCLAASADLRTQG